MTRARELREAIVAAEASYDYLISTFAAKNSRGGAAQLKLMQDILNNLKELEQELSSNIAQKTEGKLDAKSRAEGAPDMGWLRLLNNVVIQSDRAAVAAASRTFETAGPTPTR